MMGRLRKYFISGLVVFLPLALTLYLFIFILNFADGLLGKYLEPYFYEQFGFYFHGLSILVLLYLIVLVGFFVTNFLGRRVFDFLEQFLLKLPFFRQVYPAIKEMAIFLFSRDKLGAFQQVVLVEYPRKGIYSYGFLTNDVRAKISDIVHQECYHVFVPSAPGPLTGYIILVPKKEIIFTDITIEEAVKCIVSGGVVQPK